MELKVNFGQSAGAWKALHGVNNGPVCYGELIDVSHYYKQAGIPLVRLHDPNWPNPREVDINTIFPDFDRDPGDPASYDFSRTDTYVKSVLDTGAEIVFRLGQSIEHTKIKYYVHPPKDYDKWAQICIGIIRHYNQGWAEGFHYGIGYWEIWNEPENGDSGVMWSGTAQQYYDLYRVAATAIKSFDPTLKVGGYAACVFGTDYMPGFMAFCRAHALPLDFFSWHTYTMDIGKIRSRAREVRRLLDEHGYDRTETHLNEWNFLDLTDWRKRLWSAEGEQARRAMFEQAKGPAGAAFAAAVLLDLQDEPVDRANYYDGQPSALLCGLFDYYGVPQKTYYAFAAFQRLLQQDRRAAVAWSSDAAADGLYAGAGMDDSGQAAVLISNIGSEDRQIAVRMEGLAADAAAFCKVYRLDEQRTLEPDANGSEPADGRLVLELPRHSVVLLEV